MRGSTVICSCAVCQLFQFPPLKSVCAGGVNLYKGEDGHVLVDTLGWLCIRPSLLSAVRRLGCHYSLLGLMVLAPLGAKDGELDMVTYFNAFNHRPVNQMTVVAVAFVALTHHQREARDV